MNEIQRCLRRSLGPPTEPTPQWQRLGAVLTTEQAGEATAMVTTLGAPPRIGGRELPCELFEANGLSEDLSGSALVIEFKPCTLYTISFIDKLVFEALVNRKCEQLTLRGLTDRQQRVATDAADYHGVSERSTLMPQRAPGRKPRIGIPPGNPRSRTADQRAGRSKRPQHPRVATG